MDGIRLRVQVMPWQNSASGTINEAPLKAFGLPPVRGDISIAELGELIVDKFERLHTGKGKLNIKYLQDGYETLLDMDDSVGDYFVDRTSGNARIEDFTVLVHRLPPEPAELTPSFRDESVAPNSSARYLKRPRHSLLEGAAVGRYASGYAREGDGVANKRQRLGYGAHHGALDSDCPMNSRERDDPDGSISLVEDSQQSPRTSQLNTYAIPISLSSPLFPRAFVSSCQMSQTMSIPDSPTSRGAIPNEDIPEPASDHRAETPKSESPEADNIVRSIPPSDPSTPHPPMVQEPEQSQNSFRKPPLPPPRTKTPGKQTPNGHRITKVMITPQFTVPEGHKESPNSDGKLKRPTSAARGPFLEGSSGSNPFASRKVPRTNIWDGIETNEETPHGNLYPSSAKRTKQHHSFPSEPHSSEPRRESTGSREPSVGHSAIKFAHNFLKPLTPAHAFEEGPIPRSTHRPEKQTQTYPETPLAKLRLQSGTQFEALRHTHSIEEHEKITEEDHPMEREPVDTGAQATNPGDGNSPAERSSTRSVSSGDSENFSHGQSLGTTKSPAVVPGNEAAKVNREGSMVYEESVEHQTNGVGTRPIQAEGEEEEEEEDDDKNEDNYDEDEESKSEASEPEPSARKTPVRTAPAKKSPAETAAEKVQKQRESARRRSEAAVEKRTAVQNQAEQVLPLEKPIDTVASAPKMKQADGANDDASLGAGKSMFKTPSANKPKAGRTSALKQSSTPPFPRGKRGLGSLAGRSDSVSSRGTPLRGANAERTQAQVNAARSSPTVTRRSVSFDETALKTPSAAAKKPKTPDPLPGSTTKMSNPVDDAKEKARIFREESKKVNEKRKQMQLQFKREKGKGVVRDSPLPPTPAPSEATAIHKGATLKDSRPLQSGSEPGPSRGRDAFKNPMANSTTPVDSKSVEVSDQQMGETKEPELSSEESGVEVEQQPTAPVITAHGKSVSRSPARAVASSASSSSATETESETESESGSEKGKEKVDAEGRRPSSTSQEAASGTSKDIDKSASPPASSSSSSSESESDDGDLPPIKQASPHWTDKSRSASVGDEAERQLQREARESLEPSRSSQIKSSVKTPVTSKTLATVNEGSSTTPAKQEARPANTRFPSLTSLRAGSSSLPSSSTKRLPNFKMPLKGSSEQKSLGTQVNGGTNIDEVSSDEDSSTSDDKADEDDDGMGASGKSTGPGSSQRRAGKGLRGLMKLARELDSRR
ncbi:hypothetical protein MMC30_004266 [Trapelia coarctata]|nr:hypothetical protein [Trapelia coarctata]